MFASIGNFLTYFKKRNAPSLKARLQSFQALLDANNAALEAMGDVGGKYLRKDHVFDLQYIRQSYNRIRENVVEMIHALNGMVPGRYGFLYTIFEEIDRGIQQRLFGVREIPLSPLTIPFKDITSGMGEIVGGKNANLGEMRNSLNMPVPEGFAISTYAYRIFIEKQVLGEDGKKRLASLDIHDSQALESISREIREAILAAPIPEELEEAIIRGYSRLAAAEGDEILVSVRSSAVGEDTDASFAGQYATYLNVLPDRLLTTYAEVLASKFTPQAIFYWKEKGFNEEDIPMAVACQKMICARASGVIYSQDPNHASRNVVIISAKWGLGELVVEHDSSNVYVISRESGLVIERRVPRQEVMLACERSGGISEVPIAEELQWHPCLREEEINELFRHALLLERHYGNPRDIEWAIDAEGKVYILQTRPLKMSSMQVEKQDESQGPAYARVLIDWGLVASPGIGFGPVHIISGDGDLNAFPNGGVLVVKNTNTRYVTIMHRASAIITETGNVAGHMASLARESQVPTIVDAKGATDLLKSGQMITVDAYRNRVYDEVVEELIVSEKKKEEDVRKKSPMLGKVEQFLSLVAALNLWDSSVESFKPENCTTFHDVTRFIHQVAIEEMFHLHEFKRSPADAARRLITDLAVNLYMIDLGGGLSAPDRIKDVRPEQITSRPMKALWRGITHPDACRKSVAEVDLKGFASVMLNTLSDAGRYGTPLGERSYALVSSEHVNFSSRLAYHFSTVDAYCSEVKNNNYVTFQFMGGGSSTERRSRRVRFIAGVLKNLDFEVEIKGDWLRARLMKYEGHDTEEKLDYLGRLMTCSRQLDAVMYSENIIDWYVRAFMKGNYAFERISS
jgi:pyruvate,water dikinase